MINSSLLTGIAKCLGALILSVVVLWQTAVDSGSAESEVSIHVAASQVEVWVDREVFWIDSAFEEAIVCRLRPGQHELRMVREGQVVYQEAFKVERGRDAVLTAWVDTTSPNPSLASRSSVSFDQGNDLNKQ
jgi:hypothetical protein